MNHLHSYEFLWLFCGFKMCSTLVYCHCVCLKFCLFYGLLFVCVEEEDVDLTDMTHGRCEHPHTSV